MYGNDLTHNIRVLCFYALMSRVSSNIKTHSLGHWPKYSSNGTLQCVPCTVSFAQVKFSLAFENTPFFFAVKRRQFVVH